MDFTREPLVETVITPKEGFKLVIRASSGNSAEEYSVGAVEVVSFGNCFFFRSLEKPKAFLLPLTEYEVVESRETRTVLKKPQIDKSIKIGGGKKEVEKGDSSKEESSKDEPKKKENKRTRKRKASTKAEKTAGAKSEEKAEKPEKSEGKGEEKSEVEGESPDKAPAPRRTLLPPPTSLISDQIDRYKNYLVEQGALAAEDISDAEKAAEDELSKIETEKVVKEVEKLVETELKEEAHAVDSEES